LTKSQAATWLRSPIHASSPKSCLPTSRNRACELDRRHWSDFATCRPLRAHSEFLQGH
jgi:hypothetical protein